MGLKTYRTVIRNEDYVVRDHTVHGVRVLPGVALLGLIYRIGIAEGRPLEAIEVRDLLFVEPIVTCDWFDQEVRVNIEDAGPAWAVAVHGRRVKGEAAVDSTWSEKARCALHVDATEPDGLPSDWSGRPLGRALDADTMYAAARGVSIVHGEFFKTEGTLHPSADRVVAELRLSPLALLYRDSFALHPAFLDAATLVTFVREGGSVLDGQPSIPLFVGSFRAWRQTADVCRVTVPVTGEDAPDADTRRHDIWLQDTDGNSVAAFRNCVLKRVRSAEKITALLAPVAAGAGPRPIGGPAPADPAPGRPAAPNPAPPGADTPRVERVAREVREVVAGFLGRPEEQVDPSLGFYDQGLDSTQLLQIVKALESRFGTTLYPTLLFEHSTVAELSRHLAATLGDFVTRPADEEGRPAAGDRRPDRTPNPDAAAADRDASGPVGRYRLDWCPQPIAPSSGGVAGPVLVFTRGQDGAALAPALRRLAGDVPLILVTPGATFARTADARYEVNPVRERDFATLLRDLEGHGHADAVVVHAWNRASAPLDLAAQDGPGERLDRLGSELVTGVLSIFAFARAWLEVRPRARARLLYLCGAEGRPHDLAVAGFFRTLRHEHPGLRGRVVGVDADVDPTALAALTWDELLGAEAPWPAEVLYRGDRRLVRALRAGASGGGDGIAFRAGGVYLITGGGGGLGLALAEELARVYRARLALLGRGPLGPEREAKLDRLRQAGASVLFIRCDVERAGDLARAVEQVRRELGPVRGVMHAAGVVEDAYVHTKAPASFERVLGPKVAGTLNLDWATREEPLDWFALSSSVASVLGNPGQCDYAFANAFMDHFAAGRAALHGRGLRRGATIAINWPLILGAGMGVTAAQEEEIRERFGLEPLTLAEGIAMLSAVLAKPSPQVVVVKGSPRAIEGYNPAESEDTPAEAPPAATPSIRRGPLGAGAAGPPEPIAVIGRAGRYPSAADPDEFWQNLRAGKDCIREIPADRWDYRDDYDPGRTRPDGSHCKWGGFIDDHDRFDSLFFHIAPREARALDPQERLFLQTAWAALEDAGYTRRDLAPSDRREVGVFVGVMWGEYQLLGRRGGDGPLPASWFSSIANRVSYAFNFHGPSLAVDTACSSSLLAVHLACEAIRRGECRAAIAGGVNLNLHPNKYVKLSQMQMLSGAGRCRSFGAGADGYVPGEGVGAVVLKPLDAAIADGDQVHGVLLASAVNHGGQTSGYTVPSPSAQAELVGAALQLGRIDPSTITYLEAHATGTSLGDPIEVAGLVHAFRGAGGWRQRCALGSVKSNIGHLEAASGIAALTKVLLQIEHRMIAPTLHCEPVNPALDLEATPFRLQRELAPWEPTLEGPDGRTAPIPRRAGINSFGAGGVNVHLIVEEPPARPAPARPDDAPRPELIVLSARTEAALRAGARTLGQFLGDRGRPSAEAGVRLADVAHTLQVGREAMARRLAFLASSIAQAAEALAAFAEGRDGPTRRFVGKVEPNEAASVHVPNGPADVDRLTAAAEAWVRGEVVDWAALASDRPRRRISLPTYRFERERHWVDDRIEGTGGAGRAPAITVRRAFAPADDLVSDHRVRDVPVVPAAVLLGMALEAGTELANGAAVAVSDLRLIEPVLVRDGVEVELTTEFSDARRPIPFAVRSRPADGAARLHARGNLVLGGDRNAVGLGRFDPDGIRRVCPRRLDRAEIERQFAGRGIDYGPLYRVLDSLLCGEREVLGTLRAPVGTPGSPPRPRQLASVLDAALQGGVGFIVEGDPRPAHLALPHAIGSAIVDDGIVDGRYLRACLRGRDPIAGAIHLDVTIADESGRVVAALEDVQLKAALGAVVSTTPDAGAAIAYYRPSWHREHAADGPSGTPDGAVLIVGHDGDHGLGDALEAFYAGHRVRRFHLGRESRGLGPGRVAIDHRSQRDFDEALADAGDARTIYFLHVAGAKTGAPATPGTIEDAQERGVLSLFRLVKALARAGKTGRGTHLKVVTCGASRVHESDAVDPGAAALVGLGRVIRREYPDLSVSLIDVPAEALGGPGGAVASGLARQLDAETDDRRDVAIRDIARYVLQLERAELPPADDRALPLRRGGVYVILGGAGGIGFEVAAALAERTAGRIVLVGRRELDDDIRAKLARLERAADAAIYLRGDAADPGDMERSFAAARGRFGAIHGVVHSAVVLRDGALEAMSEADFHAALAAKIAGTAALDRATRRDDLDFIALFSSAGSLLGNAGQGNYLAGCAFQEAYSALLAAGRDAEVRVINWGYWGETGIVASRQYRERLARRGIHSIATAEGVAAFFRCLGGGLPQVVALKADEAALGDLLAPEDRGVLVSRRAYPRAVAGIAEAPRPSSVTAQDCARALRADERLDRWCVDALLAAVHGLAGSPAAGVRLGREALVSSLGILPKYRRQLDALLGMLVEAGYVATESDALRFTAARGEFVADDPAGRLAARRHTLLSEAPEFEGRCRLVEACLEALPEVLSGRRLATDVLFPRGSPELVRCTYAGSPVVDAFNILAGRVLREVFDRRRVALPAGEPFRILEVGAGTGATSVHVLAAFADREDEIEYYYTDISPAFLRHARQHFGGHPSLRARVLDIERPVDAQGFAPGTFDVVLAAHVMHATADLAAALLHAKRLLKGGGVLLLNEPTRSRAFLTCTFGLTDGWWRHGAGEPRLEASPLLGIVSWPKVLNDAGFLDVRVLGPSGGADAGRWGQALLLGESDGVLPVGPWQGDRPARDARPLGESPGAVDDAAPVVEGDRDVGREALETRLRELIGEALEIAPEGIEPDRSLADYGLDSIMGVDLIRRINREFSLSLRTSTLFDHPSLRRLAELLRDRVGGWTRPRPRSEGSPRTGDEAEADVPRGPGGRPTPPGSGGRPSADLAPARRQGVGEFRAVRLTQPGTSAALEIGMIAVPPPGRGQVQIATHAASLNFGDLLCARGLYPTMPEYPFVPGFEVAGIVAAIGEGTASVRVGDEVVAILGEAMGGHSERVNVDERFVIPKPPGVSHVEAAAFPIIYLTAHLALERATLREGERILIQTAAGGMGLMAVQIARARGAEIFATAGSAEKVAYLRGIGVEHVINYREEDFGERVRALTSGSGVDVVLNTLAGDAIQKGLDLLAPGGRYIEIAMTGLKAAAPVDLSRLVQNQSFASLDLRRLLLASPEAARRAMQLVADALGHGTFRATIDRVFPLEQAEAAYHYLEQRRNIGKVVLAVDEVAPGEPPEPAARPAPAVAAAGARGAIAVIGMSARFPGAHDIDEFWGNLAAGKDSITRLPEGRWGPITAGGDWWGGFLDEIDCFDPLFFNISGAEAELMDPQQRLFLEEAWKAFEHAGYSDRALARARCGVYVGAGGGDYQRRLDAEGVAPDAHMLTGNDVSILAARIAYQLDLRGPSLTVDTACSSSLVALHLACQAIQGGDCDLALAGGVFVTTTPTFHTLCGKAGMLSAGHRCRTFAADADGFVPGEGVAAVVLKPLDRALAEGDQILGVIRATAINQDGRSNGITAPSPESQARLIRGLYERTGIDPEGIGYVEAHGTGTRLGDPIEVEALTAAFRARIDRTQFCALGSVKTNIGHCVYAAGIAGLIKVLLALRHGQIPPSLHFDRPNEQARFPETPFFVNNALHAWPRRDGSPRRAALSSFGFSGTNAHAVVEEAPDVPPPARPRPARRCQLIAVSAKTDGALARRVADLKAWLERADRPDLHDIAYTLGVGRLHFAHRLAVVAEDAAGLARALSAWLEGGAVADARASGRGVAPAPPGRDEWERAVAAAAEDIGDDPAQCKARLLGLAEAYAVGAEVDWAAVFARAPGRRLALPTYPFDRGRYGPPAPAARPRAAPMPPAVPARPDSIVRRAEVQLRSLLAAHLKIDESALEPRAPWDNYGLDSMTITKLNRALEQVFGRLPKTLFFEYRSLAELAAYVAANHAHALAPGLPAGPAPADDEKRPAPAVRPSVAERAVDPGLEIAVIGVAGRYPRADDLDEFWRNLVEGRDCITEVPRERWDPDRYFNPDHGSRTTSYGRWGGFLGDVDAFDPLFFGIAPREAELMDPQERLFLQTSWCALEDAGYTRAQLAQGRPGLGGRVGVFVGVTWGSYQLFGAEEWARGRVVIPSGSYWTIANRVSHVLNVNGPSLPIDTACSSSLTAIHLACESIRRGECAMALAGGVNLYLHPLKYVGMSQQEFLSTDGRCRSFGRGGDGFVPGEGVGAVVLKPLEAALVDGDQVYAIIKGSSINHGGKAGGYTVPNPQAQAELIAAALDRAGIDPRTLSYVEAHGTGTALGDPVEIAGLCRAFGPFTADRQFCALGSVKSNIGHLESAAGIAGLTKVLLQMKHQQLVPSLHADELNPNLDLEATPFRIQRELTDWSSPARPRRAAISSFGAGGANAHLILEEPGLVPAVDDRDEPTGQRELVPLSARDPGRLRESARRLRERIAAADAGHGPRPRDVAYTLQVGREPMACRAAFLARSTAELVAGLDQFLGGGAEAACGVAPRTVQPWDGDAEDSAYFRELARGRKWETLATLWIAGAPIDWADLRERGDCRRVSLPGYPFARERYWLPRGEEMAGPSPTPPGAANPPAPAAPALGYFVEQWLDAPSMGGTRPGSDAASVLLLPASDAVSDACLAALGTEGRTVLVTPGPGFRRLGRDGWEIDPADAESYRQLAREAIDPGAASIRVHHLWDLAQGVAGPPRLAREALAAEIDRGLIALFHLSRALLVARPDARIEVLYGHAGGSPAPAAVKGFLRTLVREAPSVSAKAVRLNEGDQSPERALAALSREAGMPPGHFVDVRLDGGTRREGALRPVRLDAADGGPEAFRPEGVYVITGGAGTLGRVLARHLARAARARLVLIGRSRFGRDSVRLIKELRQLGGEAIYLQADVADLEELTAVLDHARRHFGRIDGVIHAAGVIEDALLVRKDAESFRRVLAPKVAGTLNLDAATRDDDLVLFLLFSSLAGAVGNAGQGDYAAANSFLDAFAACRDALRARGERTGRCLSIGWPLWQEGGMQIPKDRLAEVYRTTGLAPMPTAVGLEALRQCLRADASALTVVYGHPAWLEGFLAGGAPTPAPPAAADGADAGRRDARESVREYLKGLFAEEVKLPPGRIDAHELLDHYGVNSVVIRKVGARLDATFGPLPKTALFEHLTIESLASYLVENHADRLRDLPRPPATPDDPAGHADQPTPDVPGTSALPTAGRSGAGDGDAGDIAIIGLGGRYPGARDLAGFWENLRAGHDCITEVPVSRWDTARYYDPDRGRPSTSYCKWGGFLDDVDAFDSRFFNIAPRDAELMDPQERLFLEVAWQTVEDAGYTREALSRDSGEVGVFVGVTWGSYQLFGAEAWARGEAIYPNSSFWSIANRVSYILDLHGPSLAIDTACSSSLTAIHLAAESLRRGECRLAIAGGVNLYLHPSKYSQMCQMGFASSDGRCRSFGAGGDGYVPGEGVGAVLLKPLADAVRDRDHVHAVIKGSAANHGGRANGYTVPNPAAQADLVRKALAQARLDPRTISYVEAHGTGTPLGDPIEVEGLSRAFLDGTTDRRFCALGSVKSNIGHLESAAGIAGLTKVLLQMKHQQLVPTLHCAEMNPDVRLDDSPFYLQREQAEWARPVLATDGGAVVVPRRAGVSSFGAGGANAHLLLEEFEDATSVAPGPDDGRDGPALVLMSARTDERLHAVAANLRAVLATSTPPLCDLAWTLQVGREAMDCRLALVVEDLDDLGRRLDDFLAGRVDPERIIVGTVVTESIARGPFSPDRLDATATAGHLDVLARSWVQGGRHDWSTLYRGGRPPRRVSLPAYPFRGKRHWIETAPAASAPSLARPGPPSLLIDRVVPAIGPAVFESWLHPGRAVVGDHRVGGRHILPGVLALELVCEAAGLLETGAGWLITRYAWLKPLHIDEAGVRVVAALTEEPGGLAVRLGVRAGAADETHGIGHLRRGDGSAQAPPRLDPRAFRAEAATRIDHDDFYAAFPPLGIDYGPTYRGVEAAWTVGDAALGRIRLPDSAAREGYVLHPTLLDGAFQVAQLLLPRVRGGERQLYLPSSVGAVTILDCPTPTAYAHVARRAPGSGRSLARFDVTLLDEGGRALVGVRDFCVQSHVRIERDDHRRRPSAGSDGLDVDQVIVSALQQLAEGQSTVDEVDRLIGEGANGVHR